EELPAHHGAQSTIPLGFPHGIFCTKKGIELIAKFDVQGAPIRAGRVRFASRDLKIGRGMPGRQPAHSERGAVAGRLSDLRASFVFGDSQ
ncbi:MAG: hypothetical protein AAF408_01955, partial [Pseudomonadota bacterium]